MKQTFKVADMHCVNCALKIESLEDELPGVRSVSASYAKGQVVVEYDETCLSSEQIVMAIRRKGYSAILP